jgi:hypothetical protein
VLPNEEFFHMTMSDALMNETSEAGRAGRNLRLQESQFLLSGQGPALVVSLILDYLFAKKIYNMSLSSPCGHTRLIKKKTI